MTIIYVYTIIFFIFMLNSFFIRYGQLRISELIYKCFECNFSSRLLNSENSCVKFWCCCALASVYCLYFDMIKTILPFTCQCFTIKERFWRVHTKIATIVYYLLRLSLYLFGFSISVVCLIVATSCTSNLYTLQEVCMTNVVLHVLRNFIMTFLFAFCSMFNPKKKFHENFHGFLRLEEMGTSACSNCVFCPITDLAHVIKCHDKIHTPARGLNKCYKGSYAITCRKNYYIGFHQTTP